MPFEFTDVTLRDGLQMEAATLSVEQKFALFQHLVACKFQRIEITSFVNPKKVPQFADAEALCKKIFAAADDMPPLMAFVPNDRGAERLQAFPIPWTACFVSVSEAFNKKNVNATVDESLFQVEAVVNRVRQLNRKVRVYVSTVFGCPYQGKVDPGVLMRVLRTIATLQPDEIALGDTIGVATPTQVTETLALVSQFFPLKNVALHLHNTYGLALAAAQAGYAAGVRKFDGATGGIGGCPYAKGASGNVASEDLLYSAYRQGWMPEFEGEGFRRALKFLGTDLGLKLQGRLVEVWAKGGNWYGVE